ncbi:MAG: hypothetical protein UZ22_OP11002000924 [Microgenomates bacterium OLB23]|nr:MAG: hypothetical protein UZ22_OP11002000924 [Microgenomates bacterium OLB23]
MTWKNRKPLTEAESLHVVQNDFESGGYGIKILDHDDHSSKSKSPDFLLLDGDIQKAYIKVKFLSNKLNPTSGLYQHSTIFNKINAHIKKHQNSFRSLNLSIGYQEYYHSLPTTHSYTTISLNTV